MYRCQLCTAVVGPGKPLLKHVVCRQQPTVRVIAGKAIKGMRDEIEKELQVCEKCKERLDNGIPLGDLTTHCAVQLVRSIASAPPPPPPVRKPAINKPVKLGGAVPVGEIKLAFAKDSAGKFQPLATAKSVAVLESANGAATKDPPRGPICDICGEPADNGQVTGETILCPKHVQKAKGRGRSKK